MKTILVFLLSLTIALVLPSRPEPTEEEVVVEAAAAAAAVQAAAAAVLAAAVEAEVAVVLAAAAEAEAAVVLAAAAMEGEWDTAVPTLREWRTALARVQRAAASLDWATRALGIRH